MKRHQNRRSTSELLPVLRKFRVTGRAALLGAAAVLVLAPATALYAQTTTTEQVEPPTLAEDPLGEKAEPQEAVREDPAAEAGTKRAAAENAATESAPVESAPVESVPVEGQIIEQPEGTYQVTELIGAPVHSPDGEAIGQVSDLLFSEDDSLDAIVIGAGGILGFGEKEIAVEIGDVTRMTHPDDGSLLIVVNFTQEQIENAPEFVSLAAQREAEADRAAQLEAQSEQEEPAPQDLSTVPTQ